MDNSQNFLDNSQNYSQIRYSQSISQYKKNTTNTKTITQYPSLIEKIILIKIEIESKSNFKTDSIERLITNSSSNRNRFFSYRKIICSNKKSRNYTSNRPYNKNYNNRFRENFTLKKIATKTDRKFFLNHERHRIV